MTPRKNSEPEPEPVEPYSGPSLESRVEAVELTLSRVSDSLNSIIQLLENNIKRGVVLSDGQ